MSSSKTFLQGWEICSGNIYLFSANGKRQDGFYELEKREFLMACVSVCVCAKSLQSCWTLCNPMNYSLPSSSNHGILQARIVEWVPMPFFRGLPNPGKEPTSLMSLH